MNRTLSLMATILFLTGVTACSTIEKVNPFRQKTDTQVRVDVDAHKLNGLKQRIDEVATDDFGTFMVEMHRANQQLDKAQAVHDDVADGEVRKEIAATLGDYMEAGETALNQALDHRDNAEQAFNRIISVLEESSITEELSDRLAYLESIHVAAGEEIDPLNVYFSFSSARLNRTEEEKIDELVKGLRAYPIFAIRLVGYADTVGSKTRNLRLAEQRNYSVIRSLHRAGMPVNTLVSVAVGEADGPDEVRNPEDRRVEIIPYVHGRDPVIVEELDREEEQAWNQKMKQEKVIAETGGNVLLFEPQEDSARPTEETVPDEIEDALESDEELDEEADMVEDEEDAEMEEMEEEYLDEPAKEPAY